MSVLPTQTDRNQLSVGIVIPAYNAAKTLPATLDSVAALKNRVRNVRFYCVLVDDCSQDDSFQIARHYVDKGVIDECYQSPINQGVSVSRNIGITLCKLTNFITFCDADDVFSSVTFDLESCAQSDFIFFDHQLREGGRTRNICHQASFLANQAVDISHLATYLACYLERPNAFHLLTSCWSKLFSTRIIIEHNIRFDPSMKVFEDIKFNFEFLQYAHRMYYLSCLLYIHYRPVLSEFKQSASMGGHCSVVESFAFVRALEPMQKFYAKLVAKNIQQEVCHCIGAYSVITLIRSSMKIHSWRTFLSVRSQIISLFETAPFKQAFEHYDPVVARGNRILPFFIQHQWFTLALIHAYCLGKKRYSIRPVQS